MTLLSACVVPAKDKPLGCASCVLFQYSPIFTKKDRDEYRATLDPERKDKKNTSYMMGADSDAACNDVMVVMEAPTATEDADGHAFSGANARIIRRNAKACGIDTAMWHWAYLVRCCPKDKSVTRSVATYCSGMLADDVQRVKPKTIIAFGALPLQMLLGKADASIEHFTGVPQHAVVAGHSCVVFPMQSPGFILRNDFLADRYLGHFEKLARFLTGALTVAEDLSAYNICNDVPSALQVCQTMLEAIEKGKTIDCDLETSGLNPFAPGSRISMISFSCHVSAGYCIPLNHGTNPWCEEDRQRVLKDGVLPILTHPKAKLRWHNGKFDTKWIRKHWGVWPRDQIEDTMLTHYAIDENVLHGLKQLALMYTDMGDYDAELDKVLAAQTYPDAPRYDLVDLVVIGQYSACLRGESNVMRADGEWETIRSLVHRKYDGEVVALVDGRVVHRKVTAWHRANVGQKTWFRIRTKYGAQQGRCGLMGPIFTPDHQIITQRGKVAVEDLVVGADSIVTSTYTMNKVQRSVLLGSLLADGVLTSRHGVGYGLLFSQESRRAGYAAWKANIFRNYPPELPVQGSFHTYRANYFDYFSYIDSEYPRYSEEFHTYRTLIPTDRVLQELGDVGLAVWYQDAGVLVKDASCRIDAKLKQPDVDRVLAWLSGKFGSGISYNKQGFISFTREASRKFLEVVSPYMHESVAYKSYLKVGSGLQQLDEECAIPGPLFVNPIVEVVDSPYSTHRRGGGVRYCLTVEEAGNFLTKQGFVSNCDPVATRKLAQVFKPLVEEQGEAIQALAYRMMPALSVALANMEYNGVHIDVDFAKRIAIPVLQEEAQNHLGSIMSDPVVLRYTRDRENEARAKMKRPAPIDVKRYFEFSLRSPKQLNDVIFGEKYYNVTPTLFTDKGAPSTDKEALTDLAASGVSIAKQIMEYRLADKAANAFGLPLVALAEATDDHCIHPSFLAHTTKTGRLSSREPNCFSGDTEILTPQGWVRFDQYAGQEVMQWDDGECTFVAPLAIQRVEGSHTMISSRSAYVDLCTTADHRCLLFRSQSCTKPNVLVVRASDYVDVEYDRYQLHAGVYDSKKSQLDMRDDVLELLVAVRLYGAYAKGGVVITLPANLTRANYLADLLLKHNCDGLRRHTIHKGQEVQQILVDGDMADMFRYYLDRTLTFGDWVYRFSTRQMRLFIELIRKWGSRTDNKIVPFYAKTFDEAKRIQTLHALNGTHACILQETRDDDCMYKVKEQPSTFTLNTDVQSTSSTYQGTVYCVSVPSTFVMVRRGNSIVITGNCQQLPNKNGAVVKRMTDSRFGAEGVFIQIDFSQIELRVLACLSNDPVMIETYCSGGDIHFTNACMIFGLTSEQMKERSKDEQKRMRTVAKRLVFGLCVSWRTRILTKRGFVYIADVRSDDLLWDGESWVCHGGVVETGTKRVIRVGNIWCTPEHEILTDKGWVPAWRVLTEPGHVLSGEQCLDGRFQLFVVSPTLNTTTVSYPPESFWNNPNVEVRIDRVYDIINAGPHHRFQAEDRIVHNCYGIGAPGIQHTLKSDGVIVTEDEAQHYLDTFFAKFPRIAQFLEKLEHLTVTDTMALSVFGRRRRLIEASSEVDSVVARAVRQGGNHVVQSSAADLTNTSLILFDQEIRIRRGEDPAYVYPTVQPRSFPVDPRWNRCLPILQVHDMIGVDCHKDIAGEALERLLDCMQNVVKYAPLVWGEQIIPRLRKLNRVPMVAEAEVGPNWRDAYPVKTAADIGLAMHIARKKQEKCDKDIYYKWGDADVKAAKESYQPIDNPS